MKKILSMILAFSLAGCAVSAPETKPEEKKEPGKTVYRISAAKPERLSMPLDTDYAAKDFDKWSDDYDAWRNERTVLKEAAAPYEDGVRQLARRMAEAILNEEGKNVVYSPLNVYLALSMLAETTDTDSRKQILELLDREGIEDIRKAADALWNANYSSGDVLTSLLSNSVWLDNTFECSEEVLQKLAEIYHADSFRAEMGAEETDKAVKEWLDEATAGLLKEQTEGIQLEEYTRMVLISALLYKAKWAEEFPERLTEDGIFHTPEKDVTVPMMHYEKSILHHDGDGYAAVYMPLQASGGMWIVLPDEGVSVNEIAERDEIYRLDPAVHGDVQMVQLTIPKIDICSDLDLSDILKQLGISDIFDPEKADFTPVSDEDLYLSQAKHAARLMMDEEGVYAAAYTLLSVAATGMFIGEPVVFTADRPFLFLLYSESGTILFEGIVNDPS